MLSIIFICNNLYIFCEMQLLKMLIDAIDLSC